MKNKQNSGMINGLPIPKLVQVGSDEYYDLFPRKGFNKASQPANPVVHLYGAASARMEQQGFTPEKFVTEVLGFNTWTEWEPSGVTQHRDGHHGFATITPHTDAKTGARYGITSFTAMDSCDQHGQPQPGTVTRLVLNNMNCTAPKGIKVTSELDAVSVMTGTLRLMAQSAGLLPFGQAYAAAQGGFFAAEAAARIKASADKAAAHARTGSAYTQIRAVAKAASGRF